MIESKNARSVPAETYLAPNFTYLSTKSGLDESPPTPHHLPYFYISRWLIGKPDLPLDDHIAQQYPSLLLGHSYQSTQCRLPR